MVHYYGCNRPDNLKIMGIDWKVKWFSDIAEFGTCDLSTQEIEISKNVPPSMAGDVLVHEILHALWWLGCIPKKPKEERVVSVLATGLNQVFSANPLLAKWLDEIHHG